MKQLTKQDANRILAPVPYNQRLTVGRMMMPSGIHSEQLGSLKEVYWFLAPCSRSLPSVDFDSLADWVETALHDRQSAGQIRKISVAGGSYVDSCKETYDLLGKRIEEAEAVINHAAAG